MKIDQYHPQFDTKESIAINEYFYRGGWVTENKVTREFESKLCEFTGAKYCSIMPNGTLSLSIALLALGIKPNDKVLVPDYTMVATANAVKLIGATPIFTDIDESTLGMQLDEYTTSCNENDFNLLLHVSKYNDIKAIIMVSINGRLPKNYLSIKRFADCKHIPIINDAAQALGSEFDGIEVGLYGDIGSYSFSMPKIISTGQGGALITNNEELHNNILLLRDFGRDKPGQDKYLSFGINCKFTDIQAVIGIEQLKKINNRIDIKRANQDIYDYYLSDIDEVHFINPKIIDDCYYSQYGYTPWFYEILVPQYRDFLHEKLLERGIVTRKFYPSLNKEDAFTEYNSLSFPITDKITNEGLWLPSSFDLTEVQIKHVCEMIKSVFYIGSYPDNE